MTDWAAVVKAIAPHAKKAIVDMIAAHADEVFAKRGLTTPLRQATLFGHMYVETDFFTTLEENLNYSAKRLTQVWPRRFPTISAASPYAHNPRALANKTYGGRMGNHLPDDGWTFRGKGGLQTTGRENTERLAKRLGISAEECAKRLIDPKYMLDCAAETFVMLGAVACADRDDMACSTKRIQGGNLHLSERTSAKNRALSAIKKFGKVVVKQPAETPAPEEPEESKAAAPKHSVEEIQARLNELGFDCGTADGDFGKKSRSAYRDFQEENGFETDGKPEGASLEKLFSDDVKHAEVHSVRKMATVETLREAGSQTIASADTIQKSLTGAVTTGAGAIGVLSEINDQKKTVHSIVSDNETITSWLADHWQYIGAGFLAIGAAFFIYKVIVAAQDVKNRRVLHYQNGDSIL